MHKSDENGAMAITRDGRRARGELSRSAVMDRAVNLATVRGLEGLSIGELADQVGMSKAGVVALFGSKEQLQLAAVAAASDVFRVTVVEPALAAPAGLTRLRALVEAWLRYSEIRVFEGGCFFAAAGAELASRTGAVHDAVVAAHRQWREFLVGAIVRAQNLGELSIDDPRLLAFEITAVLDEANATSLLFGGPEPYVLARTAISRMLVR